MRQLALTATGLSALSFVMIGAGAAPKGPIGLANPASVHCAKIGGRHKNARDGAGNVTRYCHLPDGQVCEEWALFRDRKCVAPKE